MKLKDPTYLNKQLQKKYTVMGILHLADKYYNLKKKA